MRSEVWLNDKIQVPYRPGPVMNVNRPCILREVSPIIIEDSELHYDHWNKHPKVKRLVLIHAKWFCIYFYIKIFVSRYILISPVLHLPFFLSILASQSKNK